MQIKIASVIVDDQNKALAFYTTKLGFQKKEDIPMGEYRWLTVISPEGVDGVELALEPTAFPPSQVYQKALYEAGIPVTAFLSNDLTSEVARLKAAGVTFRGEVQDMGPIKGIMLEDGCGNLVHLVQPK